MYRNSKIEQKQKNAKIEKYKKLKMHINYKNITLTPDITKNKKEKNTEKEIIKNALSRQL